MQFPQEPLPQKVPAIQYSWLGLGTLPPTVPRENMIEYTRFKSQIWTRHCFCSEMTFLAAKMDVTDMHSVKLVHCGNRSDDLFSILTSLLTSLIRIYGNSSRTAKIRRIYTPEWGTREPGTKKGNIQGIPVFLKIGELPGQIGEPCSPGICN